MEVILYAVGSDDGGKGELRSCVREWAGLHQPVPGKEAAAHLQKQEARDRKTVTVANAMVGAGEGVVCRLPSFQQSREVQPQLRVMLGGAFAGTRARISPWRVDWIVRMRRSAGRVRCPNQHSTGPFHSRTPTLGLSPLLHLIPEEQTHRPSPFPCLKSTACTSVICPLSQVFIVRTWSLISLIR